MSNADRNQYADAVTTFQSAISDNLYDQTAGLINIDPTLVRQSITRLLH